MNGCNDYTLDISGNDLIKYQGCKRDYRIGLTHRISQWRPSSLASACLRHAIFNMSNGVSLEQASDKAVMFFLSAAKSPGLDVGVDGVHIYTLAMDFTAIIRNVLEFVHRSGVMKLHEVSPLHIATIEDTRIRWKFLSRADDSEVLHKYEFVDYIPTDIIPDLHSWDVFGDVAAANVPMDIHYISIGKRSGSHQNSPWCRVYSHPVVANTYKFSKVGGKALDGNWKPVYFQDNTKNKSKAWVDWMERDGILPSLVKHIRVRDIKESDRNQFIDEVVAEAKGMMSITPKTPINTLPKGRYRCDHPYICSHQLYCYSSHRSLDDVGIYTKLDSKAMGARK